MAMANVTMSISGADQLVRNFRKLSTRGQRKAIRRAVTMVSREWVGVVKDTIASTVATPTSSGLLRKSIGKRIKSPKGQPDVIIGVIGPRKGFATLVTRKGKALTKGGISKVVAAGGGFTRTQLSDPLRYAHLVEGGRKPRDGNRGVKGRPWLAHSYKRSLNPMEVMLRSEIRKGIEFEARKLASGT